MGRHQKRKCGEYWVGVECVVCGAECASPSDAESFSFRIGKTEAQDSIACARGHGCNRRQPSDERRPSARRVEYKHGGFWFSAEQLARANDVSPWLVRERLAAGWTVADAIGPRVSCGVKLARSRADYETRSARAVIAAGGAGNPRVRASLARAALPELERGPGRVSRRPSLTGRPSLTANAVAVACSRSGDWVRARARALGSLEAVVFEIATANAKQKTERARGDTRGRKPVLGVPIGLVAARVGRARQAIWKAARRNGRTTAEEIAARLADSANDSREVAA